MNNLALIVFISLATNGLSAMDKQKKAEPGDADKQTRQTDTNEPSSRPLSAQSHRPYYDERSVYGNNQQKKYASAAEMHGDSSCFHNTTLSSEERAKLVAALFAGTAAQKKQPDASNSSLISKPPLPSPGRYPDDWSVFYNSSSDNDSYSR